MCPYHSIQPIMIELSSTLLNVLFFGIYISRYTAIDKANNTRCKCCFNDIHRFFWVFLLFTANKQTNVSGNVFRNCLMKLSMSFGIIIAERGWGLISKKSISFLNYTRSLPPPTGAPRLRLFSAMHSLSPKELSKSFPARVRVLQRRWRALQRSEQLRDRSGVFFTQPCQRPFRPLPRPLHICRHLPGKSWREFPFF